MKGEFVWHNHEVQDELFSRDERAIGQMEDRGVDPEEGQSVLISRGVERTNQ